MFQVLVNGKPDGLPYVTMRVAEREARKYMRTFDCTARAIPVNG